MQPPPDSILQLILGHHQDLLAREQALRLDVRSFFSGLYPEFKKELELYFLQHFLSNVDQAQAAPVWDGGEAARLGTVGEFDGSLQELNDAISTELTPMLDDELGSGFEDGYLTGLWELSLMGVDVTPYLTLPERSVAMGLLLGAGYAGVSYAERLMAGLQEGLERFDQWLGAATASGMTLDQTMQGVSGILNGTVNRIEGLSGNELHRALIVGQQTSWEPYRGLLLGEMWMTRQDPLVCPYCAGLHKHMTTLSPQHDSHPNCRCWKVPIVLGENFTPVDYNGWTATVRNTLTAGA